MDQDIKARVQVIGLDVGDKHCYYHVLDVASGDFVIDGKFVNNLVTFKRFFSTQPMSRVVLECGTHSRWMDSALRQLEHESIVVNPRKFALIRESVNKSDPVDAATLAAAGLAAIYSPQIFNVLNSIQHREANFQAALEVLKQRTTLVRTRTQFVNQVRGMLKGYGFKPPKCSTESFPSKLEDYLSQHPEGASHLERYGLMLRSIEFLTEQIRVFDKRVEELATKEFPQTRLLRQITGVGPVTALTFVATIGDPDRFPSSRMVANFVGLTPSNRSSGSSSPQLRISKRGSNILRSYLVQSAHYILGPFGPRQ